MLVISSAPAANAASGLMALLREVVPIAPDTSVEEAAEKMLEPQHAGLLCLPVVLGKRVVGVVSRQHFNSIFLQRFGRDLWGRRPVSDLMNRQPLLVDIEQPLEAAAQFVSTRMGSPISEDFVLMRDGQYLGMGRVLDILAAMQSRIALGASKLEDAYRQLKVSQSALVQNEKMASLGQMVAGVAHEINTPLGYVRNNVEMLQDMFGQLREVLTQYCLLGSMMADENFDEAAVSQLLQQATAASLDLQQGGLLEDARTLFEDSLFGVDTIKELAINLRDFSRVDSAKLADVNVNDCLDQTLSITNNVFKGRVEIIKRYEDVPLVNASPSQFNQVLLNILTNAVQAIEHDKGKLLLKTEFDEQWVHVSIVDNGKGITQENLKKIFDPFFTTKPVGQGTGLGLSISYQIMRAHGGNIQVASVPGRGTRFRISLPRAASHRASSLEAAA